MVGGRQHESALRLRQLTYQHEGSSPAAARELLARGPAADWRKALELICELSEANGQLVLPAADHGRVADFVAFWARRAPPDWLAAVLKRLDTLLPRD